MQAIEGSGTIDNPAYEPARKSELPEIDLRQFISVVKRNWILICSVIAGVIVLGAIVTMLEVNKYDAVAKVLIDDHADDIVQGGSTAPQSQSSDTQIFLQTQVDIINSASLAALVVQNGGLSQDPKFFEALGSHIPSTGAIPGSSGDPKALQQARDDKAAELLLNALTAKLPVNSRVVSIQVTTQNPAYSAALANEYAANFINANLNRKFASSDYARKFLQDQLGGAKQKLEDSERELNQYASKAGLIPIMGVTQSDGSNSAISDTSENFILSSQISSSATSARQDAEGRWKAMANQPILSIPEVLQNPAVQDLLGKAATLTAQLSQERASHMAAYPSVVAMEAQVKTLNARALATGQQVKEAVHLQYQAALEKEKFAQAQVDKLRDKAKSEQDRGVQYAVLKRVSDTNRTLYDTLLQRLNQINANAGSQSNNLSLVDTATIPTKASSPNVYINLAVALIVGIVLATVIVMLREHFDNVLRAPEELEDQMGQPLLGVIPISEDVDPDRELSNPKSPISESYHTVVTNLMHATATGLPGVMVVTSASAAEGKSTTARAIAIDLARLGRKVVLVDGDLRRPTIHTRVDGDMASREMGLPSVITGEIAFADALVASSQENLYYLPCVTVPPNPTMLLASSRMAAVVAEARAMFDIVIIDSAPVLGLSDAALLSNYADGILFIVDASRFNRGSVRSSMRRLQIINANILGMVLSKFNPKGASTENAYYGYDYFHYEKADA